MFVYRGLTIVATAGALMPGCPESSLALQVQLQLPPTACYRQMAIAATGNYGFFNFQVPMGLQVEQSSTPKELFKI